MFALDEKLLALRGQAREWAAGFRAAALDVDRDPDGISRHLDLPGVRFMSTLMIPPEYGHSPELIGGHRFHCSTALERTVLMEELAVGDAGLLLGAPGPSMSGVLVDVLGDTEQKQWYYDKLLAKPTWTFFGLTEPESGSDAAAMRTRLVLGSGDAPARLTGEKRYVGNASRAEMGVVLARHRSGPLGVTAVLLETALPGVFAEPIESMGMRGARISAVRFENVAVPANRVLGRHLPPTKRGMWAAVQVFDRLRSSVAAVALGIARAAYEYVLENRALLTLAEQDLLDRLGARIDCARELLHMAAAAVDYGRDGGQLASAAKARTCRLAEDTTVAACEFFGPGARVQHPLLDKLVRDARGVEFMEGTGNIQRLNVFHGLILGKRRAPSAPQVPVQTKR
ncbi:acyl-CoA dehydrogenase family protein [Amycolatopsis sp. CA-230715]|uniref:acyl-CoA dehydrogenase family protein n=1 Tax=Amycolatopsis sp. CA-230715 TaxID=2745196 RepID=UPI001C03020C|nr:acyl-CoA dehydrogenase family protein [Amycolatopsis sp. CA-230715]QWF78782.1 hypothetical protein HUW46_02180 [Amycolatopsis sp. CA-230715]